VGIHDADGSCLAPGDLVAVVNHEAIIPRFREAGSQEPPRPFRPGRVAGLRQFPRLPRTRATGEVLAAGQAGPVAALLSPAVDPRVRARRYKTRCNKKLLHLVVLACACEALQAKNCLKQNLQMVVLTWACIAAEADDLLAVIRKESRQGERTDLTSDKNLSDVPKDDHGILIHKTHLLHPDYEKNIKRLDEHSTKTATKAAELFNTNRAHLGEAVRMRCGLAHYLNKSASVLFR
jgi:hypothetical protein